MKIAIAVIVAFLISPLLHAEEYCSALFGSRVILNMQNGEKHLLLRRSGHTYNMAIGRNPTLVFEGTEDQEKYLELFLQQKLIDKSDAVIDVHGFSFVSNNPVGVYIKAITYKTKNGKEIFLMIDSAMSYRGPVFLGSKDACLK